jgi:hypothetical protein
VVSVRRVSISRGSRGCRLCARPLRYRGSAGSRSGDARWRSRQVTGIVGGMADSVYQSDPDAAPDSEFRPGELRHLVAGNRGRLMDPRRTPVHVTGVCPETGFFEVEIDAFEDAGTRWLVPLESVASYQFAAGGATAADADLEALRVAAARCDLQITYAAGSLAREHAHARLARECSRADSWLRGRGVPASFDPRPFIESRSGWPDAQDWLSGYLAGRALDDIEEQITSAYVSNPWAGDLMLGHLIVMAELGLGALTARAPRDPGIFEGAWGRQRRADHILARTGFTRALWSRAGTEVMLYRGAAFHDRPVTPDSPSRRQTPLISATFSRLVAESHFRSPNAAAAALYRQRLAPELLFMTFLETAAMNCQFREAEAVLLADGWYFHPVA